MTEEQLKNINFWLLKSEPATWSWQMQVEQKITTWDGVRNFEARNNLQKMKLGDLAFFYHSVSEKQIVGMVKVIKEYYPDAANPKFGNVDVEAFIPLSQPLSLAEIKTDPELMSLPLVNRPRLSVMPVTFKQALHICEVTKTTLYML